ncbi:MAG: RagB/SusD family nutrient uptake outer membrane protein [Ferruginibacter sp.]|nr:RagB/SusD family nutrient uptake outer membrane protein [Ferruginibacter sp.]
MNKTIIRLSICLFIWIAVPSCKKDLETEPRDLFTADLVFDPNDKNAVLAKQFLADIYNFLPNGFNRIGGDFLDAAAGDAMPSRNNTTVEYYTNGLVSSILNPDAYWGNSYSGIRQANVFLANIDKVPATAASIKLWKAEARFIRAFMYFELLKRYGGIPLVGDKIFTLEEDLQVPRNTFDEVANYIVSECDAVKADLYPDAILDTDLGRIPKGAAIALKCRLYLYAASPLFNGGAPSGAQKAKGLLGYINNDPARWQKVIDAAEELRAINYYALQASFINVFTAKKNSEVILAKQAVNNFDLENNNAPIGYTNNGIQSAGRTSPTQNLVDAFTMLNGLAIDAPGSGYSATAPYTGRDKRLDGTIFYNGLRWLNRSVETFDGGKDRPNNNTIQTKTGYYLRKFMGDFTNNTSYANTSHNFVYFRFAEIVLNYAEALNEVGRVEDAVQQIILIRKRAGITAGTANRYGIAAGISQTDLRTLIQKERRVELAFEEHRFWDVRRWKSAPVDINGPLYGMKIVKDANNVLTYAKVQTGNMVFSDKLYFMPVPYDETTKNVNLEQNPAW